MLNGGMGFCGILEWEAEPELVKRGGRQCSNTCFEIGLVGAGAYTAGVRDFMFQALDAWYEAKAQGTPGTPPHDVRLSVFSGASAGAISMALAAGFLTSDQPAIRSPEDMERLRGRNKLYKAWVERTDISSLLEARDLRDGAPVVPLLDPSILADIAEGVLAAPPHAGKCLYVADDLHLFFTLTNLSGVGYRIPLQDSRSGTGQNMSLHADYARFCINESGTGEDLRVDYLPGNRLAEAAVSAKLR